MEDYALLRALVLVWLAALVFGYIMVRAKLPLAVGYILSGLIIGPHGLRLISNSHQTHELAEIGVALLLFTLGAEVSLKSIIRCPKKIIWVGIGQLVFTAGLAWFLARSTGLTADTAESFIFGCICALSSTVVVTKILMERGEIDALHGRLLIPVLVIQDLSLVPVISLFEAFKNPAGGLLAPLLLSIAKSCLLVACVVIAATRIVPTLLAAITKVNSRELFFLTVICLCLGVAILSQACGFSLALGAFLAGITVSESPYGHQALADLLPMRDLFASIFFVSLGLLLDPTYVFAHGFEVFAFVLLLMVGKALIAALCAYPAVPSAWTAILFGVGLAQIGEFSFVLASLAHQAGLLHESTYNLFSAGSALTLIISPGLMSVAPIALQRFLTGAGARANPDIIGAKVSSENESRPLKAHIVICGFGRTGRNLGRVFAAHDLQCLVIDLNAGLLNDPETTKISTIYGDVFNKSVLEKANVSEAACLIVTIPDPLAALGTINIVRELSKDVPIIARVNRSEDIELFRAAGANAVVQPEFEASVEIARLSLLAISRPGREIADALHDIRQHRYAVFRPDIGEDPEAARALELFTSEHAGGWFFVDEKCSLISRTIQALDVRNITGVSIVAVKRDRLIPYPSPHETIHVGDELYVIGDGQQLKSFGETFQAARFCPLSEETSDEISTVA